MQFRIVVTCTDPEAPVAGTPQEYTFDVDTSFTSDALSAEHLAARLTARALKALPDRRLLAEDIATEAAFMLRVLSDEHVEEVLEGLAGEEVALLSGIGAGRDVFGHEDADAVRGIRDRFPRLVVTGDATGSYGARDVLPFFGVKLTALGLAVIDAAARAASES